MLIPTIDVKYLTYMDMYIVDVLYVYALNSDVFYGGDVLHEIPP